MNRTKWEKISAGNTWAPCLQPSTFPVLPCSTSPAGSHLRRWGGGGGQDGGKSVEATEAICRNWKTAQCRKRLQQSQWNQSLSARRTQLALWKCPMDRMANYNNTNPSCNVGNAFLKHSFLLWERCSLSCPDLQGSRFVSETNMSNKSGGWKWGEGRT